MSGASDKPSWVRDRGDCTEKRHLENDARAYAAEVVDEYDLPIDADAYELKVSGRLSRSRGNCHSPGKDNAPDGVCLVKLSWKAYQNHGWEAMKETIRHELIHVIEFQKRGHSDHGHNFQQWAHKLDTTVHCDAPATEPDYKYLLVCERCGAEIPRQRKSKAVKKPERYNCGDCNGDLTVRKL